MARRRLFPEAFLRVEETTGDAFAEFAAARPDRGERSIRDRLIAQAIEFTVRNGWTDLTMGKLADLGGVSRQTVYNELGNKSLLAQAMVLHELALFLREVDAAFVREPDDIIKAIELAATAALELAQQSPLLRAVLSARQGADNELLPLLTTHSAPVLDTARAMITEHALDYGLPLAKDRLEDLIDFLVRLVLSHVMQPNGKPADTAKRIAWICERVLQTLPKPVD